MEESVTHGPTTGGPQSGLRVESAGRIWVLTLDRPHARNAIDDALAAALAAAVDAFEADPEARVAVITGSPPGFSAGMDLKAFAAGERGLAADRGFAGLTRVTPAKPVVAAIEGFALAGGLEIALACDLIVAARDARLGLPEARLGIVAAAGGALRLPARIPHHVAMEMLLTGAPIDASRAGALGLVNRVTEPGEALATAVELAGEIAANGPIAIAVTRRLVELSPFALTADVWSTHDELASVALSSAEALEGARAFAERREPSWRPQP